MRIEYLDAFLTYYERGDDRLGWWQEKDYKLGSLSDPLTRDESFLIIDNAMAAKHHLRMMFAFAIPTEEAIREIASLSPIVEMGAGTGYWAYLLQQAGARVVAYDIHPGRGNEWVDESMLWTDVKEGNPVVLADYPDHALLLCWPPYGGRMAEDCLVAYEGDTVVYVGEGEGGCTGSQKFHDRLEHEWDAVKEITIPQFPGIHDYVAVYNRKDLK